MMNQDLLAELLAAEGFNNLDDFLECYATDSIVPGICDGCHGTTDCAPDARDDYCEYCGGTGVQSGLVLAGIS